MPFWDSCTKCCSNCCSCLKKSVSKNVTLPTAKEAKSMPVRKMTVICKEKKNVFALSVKIMHNFLGQPCYPYLAQPKQLYPYIIFICGKEAQEVLNEEEWFTRDVKDVQITLVIKEGKIIHPKYTEFSEVYCTVWVGTQKKYYSSVKENNLCLDWDEVFNLAVSNFEEDMLYIELWSSRPRAFKGKKTQDVSEENEPSPNKAGHYLIGCIEESIKDLPCVGQDKLLPLKKKPRRTQTRGQLSVFIQICAKKGKGHVFQIQMHMELLKLSYEKQLDLLMNAPTKWKNWLEILPNAALSLIQQHAIQYGIIPTEQCVCSWIVASTLKINAEDRISYYFLCTLLEGLMTDIYADPVEKFLEQALYNSLSSFADFALDSLGYMHDSFDVRVAEEADELFYLLKCMNLLEVESRSNYMETYTIIAEESSSWYFSIFDHFKDELEDEEMVVEKISAVLQKVVKIYLKNQIILDDIFMRAWNVSYSSITYNHMDAVINDAIRPIIEHVMHIIRDNERQRVVVESLLMLQLYHNVRNLVNYMLKDLPSERNFVAMDAFSTWFGEDLILEWFLLCDLYTKPFIKKAVDADKMECIDKSICHGTSVPDVVNIIDEMVIDVWIKLQWNEQFSTQNALMSAIKTSVLHYTKRIGKKMDKESFFGERPHGINEKLCVFLSNLNAVFEHLYLTRIKIKGILRKAEYDYNFHVVDQMLDIGNEMQIEISDLYLKVLNEIGKIFRSFSLRVLRGRLDIFQTGSTIIADMCAHAEKVLEMLYVNLKPEVFYILLRQLWIMIVVSFKDNLSCWKGGCATIIFRKRTASMAALQAITQLQEIFYCDGHGLAYEELRNPQYEELRTKIESRLQTTE